MNYRLPASRMRDAMKGGGIREILNKASALERAGKRIIHLEIGRPDYDSPFCAKEAAKKALDEGRVHYTDTAGTLELRRAIADAIGRDTGMDIDPEREIVVTTGAVEALAATFFAFLDPMDEVIAPTPFFAAYADQIAVAGGVLREVPCRFENGFRLDPKDIEAAVTKKTRLLLINTPNNPTGAALSRDELSDIASIALKHDIIVVSDECYEKFMYDRSSVSIASLPGMRERTITISSASKTFSMTGWRVGWIFAPAPAKPYLAKAHQNLTSCATSFAQSGVAEAFRSASDDVKRMIDGYRARRDAIVGRLANIDGFEVNRPEGAFYVFPRVERLTLRFGMSAPELSSWLLDEAGVATVPGEAFHAQGNFLRMAYCRSLDEIHEGLDKIEAAVKKRTGTR